MLNEEVNTRVICSNCHDSWYNLALEEQLLKGVGKREIILYLWQNDNTIVIGRNQNPWKECQCKRWEEQGGKIARRLSGGGTVFHDLGNLNFTFIMDKKLSNLEKQLKVILNAVKKLGIDAEFSGRNDIVAKGKKFSGNAFYEEDNLYYHHGTILVNSDMDRLVKYLKVSKDKISCKGIDSVQSRVVNLKTIDASLTVGKVKNSIIDSFLKIYGGNLEIEYIDYEKYPLEELYLKYSSWEWRYGETSNFDINFSNRFKWGEIDLNISLNNGFIDTIIIYSDAMDCKLINNMEKSLEKISFKREPICESLCKLSKDNNQENIIQDIIQWLINKIPS